MDCVLMSLHDLHLLTGQDTSGAVLNISISAQHRCDGLS